MGGWGAVCLGTAGICGLAASCSALVADLVFGAMGPQWDRDSDYVKSSVVLKVCPKSA